jgi:hypothetical protein
MNGISSKLASAGLAGAIAGVLIWVASLFGLEIPAEVGVYISTIIGVIVGYFVPETRSIPITDVKYTMNVAENTPADTAAIAANSEMH